MFVKYFLFNKKFLFIFFFIVFSIALFYSTKTKVTNFLKENNETIIDAFSKTGLMVNKVIVEGNHFMDSSEILSKLNIGKKFIFSVNLKKIQSEFLKNPWIEQISVMRIIPETILIKIKEKEPAAIFCDGNKNYVVDINGNKITEDTIGVFSGLIKLAGEGSLEKIPEILSIANSESLISGFIKEANWIGQRRWDIILKNNTTIKLPEENPLEAWRYIATLQQKKAILTKNERNLDLRIRGKIFIHNNNNKYTTNENENDQKHKL